MGLTGKWQLVSVENVEAFLKEVKASPEIVEKMRALHSEVGTNPNAYVMELTVDRAAGKARRVGYIRGEKARDSGLFNLNEEFDHTTLDGRAVKCRVTAEDDNTVVAHEKGPQAEGIVTLAAHGDELTVTLKCNDVVSTEKFKRV